MYGLSPTNFALLNVASTTVGNLLEYSSKLSTDKFRMLSLTSLAVDDIGHRFSQKSYYLNYSFLLFPLFYYFRIG